MSLGDLGWLVLGVLLWLWDHVVPKTPEAWIAIFLGWGLVVAWHKLMGKLDKIIECIAALDGRVRDLTAAIRGKEDGDYEEDDD
jgi:hypothetical protein